MTHANDHATDDATESVARCETLSCMREATCIVEWSSQYEGVTTRIRDRVCSLCAEYYQARPALRASVERIA